MDSITAKCPECNTQYQLTRNQLSVADGKVRCGACMTVFQAVPIPQVENSVPTATPDEDILIQDGIDDHKGKDEFDLDAQLNDLDSFSDDFGHIDIPDSDTGAFHADEEWAEKLLEDLESEDGEEQAFDKPFTDAAADIQRPHQATGQNQAHHKKAHKPKPLGADLGELDELDELLYLSKEEEDELSMLAGAAIGDDKKNMRGRIQPEPLEFKVAGHSNLLKNLAAGGLILLLLAVLGSQALYFDFDRLARLPAYRGLYQSVCQHFGCQLPDQYDLNAVSANHLSVKSHPYLNGILLVDSLLTNHAGQEQPFPTLELYFTDKNDNVVAARRFPPQDYLRGELVDYALMPSRQPIHIAFEIVDPGKQAAGYSMRLSYAP